MAPRYISSAVHLQSVVAAIVVGLWLKELATPATPATTHAERGLEHGDKSGDSRHFLPTLLPVLDRLFERV
jgi:hypothetical protein